MPDATVSVNGKLVIPGLDGDFSADVILEEGPNLIEIIASILTGDQEGTILTIIYIP